MSKQSTAPNVSVGSLDQEELKELGECYKIVSERRLHYEVLLWQVPTLSLTGQAFLFTIALSPTSSTGSRVISMILSILISYLTAGTFAKHSLMEGADRIWLRRVEFLMLKSQHFGSGLEWAPNGSAHLHEAWLEGRTDIWRVAILERSAYSNKWMVQNWIWAIRAMMIIAGVIIIISVTKPRWLDA